MLNCCQYSVGVRTESNYQEEFVIRSFSRLLILSIESTLMANVLSTGRIRHKMSRAKARTNILAFDHSPF